MEQSIAVIKAPFKETEADRSITSSGALTIERLVRCDYYTVEKIDVNGKAELEAKRSFMNVSVIDGEGEIDGIRIKKGTHFIIPSDYGIMQLSGRIELIISYIEEL